MSRVAYDPEQVINAQAAQVGQLMAENTKLRVALAQAQRELQALRERADESGEERAATG